MSNETARLRGSVSRSTALSAAFAPGVGAGGVRTSHWSGATPNPRLSAGPRTPVSSSSESLVAPAWATAGTAARTPARAMARIRATTLRTPRGLICCLDGTTPAIMHYFVSRCFAGPRPGRPAPAGRENLVSTPEFVCMRAYGEGIRSHRASEADGVRRRDGGAPARDLRLGVLHQEPAPAGLRQPAQGAAHVREGGRRQRARRLRGGRDPARRRG